MFPLGDVSLLKELSLLAFQVVSPRLNYRPLNCYSRSQIPGTTICCFIQVWKCTENHVLVEHWPRERKTKVVKETWEGAKLQFKHLLFTRYCAKCWETNSEQHRWGPQHHRPCTVAWLTAHTSSAITMQWNNVTGEQKAYVISKDSQRKQFLRSRGYPGDRSELGRSSWGWRGMRETLGSWSVVRQRLAPKV